MRATHPICYKDGDEYVCELRDRKTGRIWSKGYGTDRVSAINDARDHQPKEAFIKRAIGWVAKHPFKAALAVGAYMFLRPVIKAIADKGCWHLGRFAERIGLPEKVVSFIGNMHKILP